MSEASNISQTAAGAQAVLGLDHSELAEVLGVSEPMLASLISGERARIGNPIATGRLLQLRQLINQVSAGATAPADVALALAQIRASTVPAQSGDATARAGAPAVPAPAQFPPPGGGPIHQSVPAPPLITQIALTYARSVVARHVATTPAYRWPLLEQALRTETWVKHENHTPIGAFKVRGGLNYLERLRVHGARPPGLVSATRGNHGQSLAFAGRAYGVPVVIVVPEGNSPDKFAAMQALGAELVVHGADFQAAREYADTLAHERGLAGVPAFHQWLVEGVATYAAELHEQVRDLDTIYVPVGMGSGIAANIAVRDLLGLRTEIVGVVAEGAPAHALSFAAGHPVSTETADTFVDGVACRVPDPTAASIIRAGASRIVQVSEEAAAEAMALMYRSTHNLAEPAGSLALAGALAEREHLAGRRVAVVHTGGNCDADVLLRALGSA